MPRASQVARIWAGTLERLPLVAYLGVYLFTCYVGALALMFSGRFRTIFGIFSGANVPELYPQDLAVILVLLHASPVLMWVGYEAALRWGRQRQWPSFAAARLRSWWPRCLAAASFSVALFSLWRAGAWRGFAAWLDYNAYVYARWSVFDTLTFFEFVNLYTVMPVCAGYLLLTERRRVIGASAVLLTLLLQYPLAIRKVLLTSVLLLGVAVYVHLFCGESPRRRSSGGRQLSILIAAPFLLYLAYLGLTLQTVVRADAKPFISQGPAPAVAVRPGAAERRGTPVVSFVIDDGAVEQLESNRLRSLVLYAFFSPLTRTSVSALAYPAIFPRIHPFYRPDLGQDILGFGGMPDDNLVVYRLLWPGHHRGSVAAPYQFVLYAQGGVLIALSGSLLVGVALGVAWSMICAVQRPDPLRSLLGSQLVVLAIFLAIDSLRNSTIVSYGLGWGVLAVLVAGAGALRLSHDGRQPVERPVSE